MSERDLDDLLLSLRAAANPADELAAAETRLLDRLDQTMASRPRALGVAFRTARRTVLATVAVAGALVGATATAAIAVALPSSGDGPGGTTTLAAEPANPTTVPLTAVARSTQRLDPSEQRVVRVIAQQHPDLRIEEARVILTPDGGQAWVVPGTVHTCFGARNRDGSGYTCATNARTIAGALSTSDAQRDGTVRAMHLVPDDVIAARIGDREVRPQGNLVVATYREGTPLLLITKDGSRTTLPR